MIRNCWMWHWHILSYSRTFACVENLLFRVIAVSKRQENDSEILYYSTPLIMYNIREKMRRKKFLYIYNNVFGFLFLVLWSVYYIHTYTSTGTVRIVLYYIVFHDLSRWTFNFKAVVLVLLLSSRDNAATFYTIRLFKSVIWNFQSLYLKRTENNDPSCRPRLIIKNKIY